MSDQEKDPSAIAQLSKSDYWEWRCSIEEITSAKYVLSITQQKLKIMELEAEVQKLRAAIFKQSVKSASDNLVRIEKDFQEYRKRLEGNLGISLENCVIDEFDYSIKKL